MLVVQKYGGTSVKDLERIKNVANRVKAYRERGDKMVVVVSAMSGETDRLLNLAHGIDKFPDEREVDVLISTGEQVTSALLAMMLKTMGFEAISVLGHQVPIFVVERTPRMGGVDRRRDDVGALVPHKGDGVQQSRRWFDFPGQPHHDVRPHYDAQGF